MFTFKILPVEFNTRLQDISSRVHQNDDDDSALYNEWFTITGDMSHALCLIESKNRISKYKSKANIFIIIKKVFVYTLKFHNHTGPSPH